MNAIAAATDSSSKTAPGKSQVFVGRQPIFDRNRDVHAYELLYRSGTDNRAEFTDGDRATIDVVMSTFIDIGVDRLIGNRLAFINVTREFILEQRALTLPPEQVVLEILEDVEVDDRLVQAVTDLVGQGYAIALDEFVYHERLKPLVELANVVKVDVTGPGMERIADEMETLRLHGIKLLAHRVETPEKFDALLELGFDYFQGYFLAKPCVLTGKRLPTNKLAVLRVLATVHDHGADFGAVEELVAQDVALSYKLLRFINSAFFALPQEVTSIQRAVVYMGHEALKRWVSLMALASVDDKPSELMRTVLVRAKMCEKLCEAACSGQPGTGFTAGLFSALDALMDRPLDELLGALPLSEELLGALLEHTGAAGAALSCALAYERGDWARASFRSLEPDAVRTAYLEAVDWASEVARQL